MKKRVPNSLFFIIIAEKNLFFEELKKIDSDRRLSPERKMKARESARKRRNAKLAQVLTSEQMAKFRQIWREHARPGGGEQDPTGSVGEHLDHSTVRAPLDCSTASRPWRFFLREPLFKRDPLPKKSGNGF